MAVRSGAVAAGPAAGDEGGVRDRLGVPAGATEVVVVTESTHWDPNWLLGSREYYRLCVRRTLDRVLDELDAEPRRVFSLECLFFVDLYWNDHPGRRDQIRNLVNEGRLRFTGCGVTTPDTLLPEDELLLRDLLYGQEWLRRRGMDQEPRLLYLPDSFGHSPGLPSLLRAAGIDHAAVCRIDGMRFPGADLEPAGRFPRPGSSAAELIEAGTADFVWRAADGSEVLTHWMSHSYGHGDMIASGGLSRALGLPASWPDRRANHVDRRVERYLADLRPLARTPYRLLAVGFDFVRPVPRLVELLDGWNERHHRATGTWLVNAGIDDYLDLVSAHRSQLPVIDLDPNPYWMGFYATRPEIKARARDLGRRLIATDAARSERALIDRRGEPWAENEADRVAASSWWTAVTSNHHDFVTGTAPDRVARGEQARWLDDATAATPWPAKRPIGTSEPGPGQPHRPRHRRPLRTDRCGSLVTVEAPWGTAVFDAARGGAMVELVDASGAALQAGPSLVLESYLESGGLWRMGQELHGGRWSLSDRSIDHSADVDVDIDPEGGAARVRVRAVIDGRIATLSHALNPDRPAIVTHTDVHAPPRRTVVLVNRQASPATGITMHQPGGIVRRPLRRWYEPTYWPLHSFAVLDQVIGGKADGGLVVATGTPTGVHVTPDGSASVVVARTAIKEIAFRVVPVMAPAWGRRWPPQQAVIGHEWRRAGGGDGAIGIGRRLAATVDAAAGRPPIAVPARVDDPDVEIIAAKPADRGPGLIIRLRDWALPPVHRTVRVSLDVPGPADLTSAHLISAHLTDSRERDLEELTVVGGIAEVPLVGHLSTVRLTG